MLQSLLSIKGLQTLLVPAAFRIDPSMAMWIRYAAGWSLAWNIFCRINKMSEFGSKFIKMSLKQIQS